MIPRKRASKQNWPYSRWPDRRGAAMARWGDYEPRRDDASASRMFRMLVATALVGVCITVLTGIGVARLHWDHLGTGTPAVSSKTSSAESRE
jgi:hypothetical protein